MRTFGLKDQLCRLLTSALLVSLCKASPSPSIPSDTIRSVGTKINGSYAPHKLESIIPCNEAHWSYSESRESWSREHSTRIPTISTITMILYSISTITLCDGLKRAGNDLISTTTWNSSVSTRTFESLSDSIYPTSDFPECWNLPCNPCGCTIRTCTVCVITTREVKLYHWPLSTNVDCSPTPASKLAPSDFHRPSPDILDDGEVTSDGFTFTSPSLYFSFYDIHATNTAKGIACGGPAPTGRQAIVSFHPLQVRSARYGMQHGLYTFNVNDLARTAASGRNASIPLVSSAAYYGQYRCNFGGNSCTIIRDDYRPLAIPDSDITPYDMMDDEWWKCNAFDPRHGLRLVAMEEIGKGETKPMATEEPSMKMPRAVPAGMITPVP